MFKNPEYWVTLCIDLALYKTEYEKWTLSFKYFNIPLYSGEGLMFISPQSVRVKPMKAVCTKLI